MPLSFSNYFGHRSKMQANNGPNNQANEHVLNSSNLHTQQQDLGANIPNGTTMARVGGSVAGYNENGQVNRSQPQTSRHRKRRIFYVFLSCLLGLGTGIIIGYIITRYVNGVYRAPEPPKAVMPSTTTYTTVFASLDNTYVVVSTSTGVALGHRYVNGTTKTITKHVGTTSTATVYGTHSIGIGITSNIYGTGMTSTTNSTDVFVTETPAASGNWNITTTIPSVVTSTNEGINTTSHSVGGLNFTMAPALPAVTVVPTSSFIFSELPILSVAPSLNGTSVFSVGLAPTGPSNTTSFAPTPSLANGITTVTEVSTVTACSPPAGADATLTLVPIINNPAQNPDGVLTVVTNNAGTTHTMYSTVGTITVTGSAVDAQLTTLVPTSFTVVPGIIGVTSYPTSITDTENNSYTTIWEDASNITSTVISASTEELFDPSLSSTTISTTYSVGPETVAASTTSTYTISDSGAAVRKFRFEFVMAMAFAVLLI